MIIKLILSLLIKYNFFCKTTRSQNNKNLRVVNCSFMVSFNTFQKPVIVGGYKKFYDKNVKKDSELPFSVPLTLKFKGIFPAWKYIKPYRLFNYCHYIDVFLKHFPKFSTFPYPYSLSSKITIKFFLS